MALRKRRTFVGGGKVIARKEVRKLGHELGCWRELKTFQDNLHIHAAYCKFCGLEVRVVHKIYPPGDFYNESYELEYGSKKHCKEMRPCQVM